MARQEPLPTVSTCVKCYSCQRDYPTAEFPVEYNEDGCECCPECGSDFVELIDELPVRAATSSGGPGTGSATSGGDTTSSGVSGAASVSASGTSQRRPSGATNQPPAATAHNTEDSSSGQRSTGIPARIEFHATFDHRPVHGGAGPLNFVDAISRFAPVNLPNGQQAFVLQVQDGALLSPFTMSLPFGDTLALNPADWVVGEDLDAVVTRLLDAYAPPRRAADQQVRDSLPRRRVRPGSLSSRPTLEQAAAATAAERPHSHSGVGTDPTPHTASAAPALAAAAAVAADSAAARTALGSPNGAQMERHAEAVPPSRGQSSSQQPLVSVLVEVMEAGGDDTSSALDARAGGQSGSSSAGVRLRLSVLQAPPPSGEHCPSCSGGSNQPQQLKQPEEEQGWPVGQRTARQEKAGGEGRPHSAIGASAESGGSKMAIATGAEEASEDTCEALRPVVSLQLEMQEAASEGGAVREDDGGRHDAEGGDFGSSAGTRVRVRLQVASGAEELAATDQPNGMRRKDYGSTRKEETAATAEAVGALKAAADFKAACGKAAAGTAAVTPAVADEEEEDGDVEGGFASCQSGELCTVCHDALAAGSEVVELPCRHCFHEDCIMPWLQQQNTCPVCRKRVDEGATARPGASGSSHSHHRRQQQPHQHFEPREEHHRRLHMQQPSPQQQPSQQATQGSQQQAQQQQQRWGPTGGQPGGMFPDFLIRMSQQQQPQPQPPQGPGGMPTMPVPPARPVATPAAPPVLDPEMRQAAESALSSLRSQFGPLSLRNAPTSSHAYATPMHPAAALAAAAAGPPGALEDVMRSLGMVPPGRPSPGQGSQQGQGPAQGAAVFAVPAMRAGFLNTPGFSLFGTGNAPASSRDANANTTSSSSGSGGGTRSALRGGFFNNGGGAGSGTASAASQRPQGAPPHSAGGASTGGSTATRTPGTRPSQGVTGRRPKGAQSAAPAAAAVTPAAGARDAAAAATASDPNVPDVLSTMMALGNPSTGPTGTGGGGSSRTAHAILDPSGMMEMIPRMLWDMALWVVLDHGSPQALLAGDATAVEGRRQGRNSNSGGGGGGRGAAGVVEMEEGVAWRRLVCDLGMPNSDDDTQEEDESEAEEGEDELPEDLRPHRMLQRALESMAEESPAARAAGAYVAAEAMSEIMARRNVDQRMDEQRRRRALMRLVSQADAEGAPRPSERQLRELQQRAVRGAEHVARNCVLPPAIPPIMLRVTALADAWLCQATDFVQNIPPHTPTSSSTLSTAAGTSSSRMTTATASGSAAPAATADNNTSGRGSTVPANGGRAREGSCTSSDAKPSPAGHDAVHRDADGGSSDSNSVANEVGEDEGPTRRVARHTEQQDAATLAHSKVDSTQEKSKGVQEVKEREVQEEDGVTTPAGGVAAAAAARGAAVGAVVAPGTSSDSGRPSPPPAVVADVKVTAAAAGGSRTTAVEEPGRGTVSQNAQEDTSGLRPAISSDGSPEGGTGGVMGVAKSDANQAMPKATAQAAAGARKVRAVTAAKRPSVKALATPAAGGPGASGSLGGGGGATGVNGAAAVAPGGARRLASPRGGSGSPRNSSSGAAASDGSGAGAGRGFNPVSVLVGGAGLGLRFLGGVVGALFRRGGGGGGNGVGNRGA